MSAGLSASPFLSIVVPIYRHAECLRELHARLNASINLITENYEIIFINDGSPDNALDVLISLQEQDKPHVVIIDLTRNFGQHQAIWTGISHARGSHVFILDGDLEEQPEWLSSFIETMRQAEADIVFSVSATRERPGMRGLLTRIFYFLLSTFSETETKPGMLTARLMTRRYVDALLMHGERNLELSVLCHLTGFSSRTLTLHKPWLHSSAYRWSSLLDLAHRYLVSASLRPLHIISAICIGTGTLAMATCILFFIIQIVSFSLSWQDVLTIGTGMGAGFIFLALGIINTYLAAVLKEVRQRPLTIIRQVYEDRYTSQ